MIETTEKYLSKKLTNKKLNLPAGAEEFSDEYEVLTLGICMHGDLEKLRILFTTQQPSSPMLRLINELITTRGIRVVTCRYRILNPSSL